MFYGSKCFSLLSNIQKYNNKNINLCSSERLESPTSSFFKEENDATITCKFKGNNKATLVNWYKSEDQGKAYKLFNGESGRYVLLNFG